MQSVYSTALVNWAIDARNLCFFKDFNISVEVTPVKVYDCAEAILVEPFKESYTYLPTPPFGQDMTQGQFFSRV